MWVNFISCGRVAEWPNASVSKTEVGVTRPGVRIPPLPMLSSIAIIPARYASTRFPGKPLVKFAGKSLIQHVFESAKRSPLLTEVVIATDDRRIFEHVQAFGAPVVMTSATCKNGTERIAEVIESNEIYQNYDCVFNLQGDEPGFNPAMIEAMLTALEESPDCVMSTPICFAGRDATSTARVKCTFDLMGRALYFSRALIPHNKEGAWDEAIEYYLHVGLYCYRMDFLRLYKTLAPTPLSLCEDLEQLKVLEHGFRIKVVPIPQEWHLGGVDLPSDIQRMETLLCKQNISSSLEA